MKNIYFIFKNALALPSSSCGHGLSGYWPLFKLRCKQAYGINDATCLSRERMPLPLRGFDPFGEVGRLDGGFEGVGLGFEGGLRVWDSWVWAVTGV